jgi:hypothetical protein
MLPRNKVGLKHSLRHWQGGVQRCRHGQVELVPVCAVCGTKCSDKAWPGTAGWRSVRLPGKAFWVADDSV